MTEPTAIARSLERVQRRAFVAGGVASVLLLVGLLVDSGQFFESYLKGYLLWLGPALGSFGFVLLHKLTGGAWGFAIRRLLEAALRTLPVLALLFLPLVFGIGHLYEWSHRDVVESDPILLHKSAYLNVPFFLARAAFCFVAWIAFSRWFLALEARHDHGADPRILRRLRNLAGPGLALYVLTMSFAATDWAMSIEPHWYSTVYGAQIVVGQALSALCFAILAASVLYRHEPFSRWLEKAHLHDLGNLMLAFVLLWAYTSFTQYLIIWSGNLPEEATWYLHRTAHGWQAVSLLLALLHFAAPFALLLSRRNKRSVAILSGVALGLFVMRWLEMHWLIAPAFHPNGPLFSWMDPLAPVAIGGIWLGTYVRMLRGRPLLSLHDARLHAQLEGARHA